MTRRVQENVVAVIVLAIFLAAIIASMQYGPRARLVPIPIASLGAILTIAQLILQNFRRDAQLQVDLLDMLTKKAQPHADAKVEGPDTIVPASPQGAFGLKDLAAVGVVAVLVILVLALGPYAAMFVFAAGYFIAARQYTVPIALIFALGISILLYLMFGIILGVEFDLSPVGFGYF